MSGNYKNYLLNQEISALERKRNWAILDLIFGAVLIFLIFKCLSSISPEPNEQNFMGGFLSGFLFFLSVVFIYGEIILYFILRFTLSKPSKQFKNFFIVSFLLFIILCPIIYFLFAGKIISFVRGHFLVSHIIAAVISGIPYVLLIVRILRLMLIAHLKRSSAQKQAGLHSQASPINEDEPYIILEQEKETLKKRKGAFADFIVCTLTLAFVIINSCITKFGGNALRFSLAFNMLISFLSYFFFIYAFVRLLLDNADVWTIILFGVLMVLANSLLSSNQKISFYILLPVALAALSIPYAFVINRIIKLNRQFARSV